MATRTATPLGNAARILMEQGYSIDDIVPFIHSLENPTDGYVYIDELSSIDDFLEGK